MTKAMHAAIIGLVVSLACQSELQAAAGAGDSVRFSLGVMGQKTDNRDASETDEQDNIDIYIRPRVDISYDSGGSRLNLYYIPAYRYRSEPGDSQDDSAWQHELSLKAMHDLSARSRVRLYDAFSVADDPSIEEGGIRRRGDYSYTRNVVEAGLNYDVLKYSNLDLIVRNRIKRFDDAGIAATSDEDELTAKAEHRHQINQTLRSLLTLGYSMFSYDDTLRLMRDFDSITAAVGVENAFTPNTMGTLSVGWQTREYDDPGTTAKGMPYARASLEGLLNSDLRAGVVLGHGLRDSDAYPFSSQEFTDLRAFANATLSPSVNLLGSLTYRVSSYDEDDIPSRALISDFIGSTSGDETTIVGDIGVTVSVMDNLSLLAGHRYEDIDSDVGHSYTKNTTRIGATLSF